MYVCFLFITHESSKPMIALKPYRAQTDFSVRRTVLLFCKRKNAHHQKPFSMRLGVTSKTNACIWNLTGNIAYGNLQRLKMKFGNCRAIPFLKVFQKS